MARLPDFLIIGSMKGGTTVLYEFINEHELVVPAAKKEIHYFSLFPYEGVDWYKRHFPADSEKLVGEASPTYFHMAESNTIPESIRRLMPGVKLILIIRDPVERAISHFSHLCRINKIQRLVEMDINEFFGRSYSKAFLQTDEIDYYLAQVLSFSSYYRKYINYLRVFEKEQLLVVSNEELRRHPQCVMRRVFEFLGVEPITSKLFEQFKYSTGAGKRDISEKNLLRLKEYLYPDYEAFCRVSGLKVFAETKRAEPNPDVMEGSQGWLFLKGGSNKPLGYYIGKNTFDVSQIESWHLLLGNRYRELTGRGIEYVHLFVPNKLTLYPEFSKVDLPYYSKRPIKVFMEYINGLDDIDYLNTVIDPVPFLKKQKEHYQLFWKTDTHWNMFGCFCAYQLVCSRLGVKQNRSLLARKFVEGECVLDLGGKMNPQRKEIVRFYDLIEDAERVYANEMVKYKEEINRVNDADLHTGSNVVYKNSKAENQKVVVLFGDSFSEYRPSLLTAMLAETFSDVHFVWSTSIDYEYIDAVNPDIVITQIVERFMHIIPKDNFNLDQYVKKRLRLAGASDKKAPG